MDRSITLTLACLLLFQSPASVEYASRDITAPVPPVQQPNSFSCEVACCMSLLAANDLPTPSYSDLERKLRANRKDGTDYRRTVAYLRKVGLEVEVYKDMPLSTLEDMVVNKRRPVMMSIQAYGPAYEYDKNKHGHEVICVGKSGDRWLFMDPSSNGGLYGWLSEKELLARWHDSESDGVISHLGIVVCKNEPHKFIAKHID